VVRFQVGQGPGVRNFETVLYTRGARRPPGT